MKLGTYLLKGAGSAQERLIKTREAGFDFIALGGSLLTGAVTPEMCARAGLPIDNVHLSGPKTTLIWSDTADGDAICERYCDEIVRATEMGVHVGIAHITWGFSAPAPVSDIGLDRYARIAEVATKNNFVVALENSVFPGHLHAVLEKFRIPAFGHCFDSGHRNAFAPEEDFLGRYGDRLAATHIADNDGKHDLHLLPFWGTCDFDRVARELARTVVGRDRICAEPAAPRTFDFKGAPAEQIDADLRRCAFYETGRFTVRDGEADIYPGMTFDEEIVLLYERMKKLGGMIDAEAAKIGK